MEPPPRRNTSTNTRNESLTPTSPPVPVGNGNVNGNNGLYDEISISGIPSLGIFLRLINYFIQVSFRIRLLATVDFGTVIHEFDPYFNFLATEVSEYILYVV